MDSNGVDKIDIRKSIISRIERVTIVPVRPNIVHKEIDHLTDRTGHDCAQNCVRPKILVNYKRRSRATINELPTFSLSISTTVYRR